MLNTNRTKNLAEKFADDFFYVLPQYGCTAAVPHVYNSHKDILENLLPV